MDNLKRIREPLTWALVGATVAAMVLSVSQTLLYMDWNQDDTLLFWLTGVRLLPYELALALVAAVWGCAVAPAVPRARGIALFALAVVTIGTVGTAFLMVVAVTGARELVEVVSVFTGGALDLMIGVLAMIALWALARPAPVAAHPDVAAIEPARTSTPADAPDDRPADQPAPVWGRGEAVGAAWRTADEAASGAPGSTSFPSDPPDEAEAQRPPAG